MDLNCHFDISLICDCCGRFIDDPEENPIEGSELSITFDYNSEDACFGNYPGEEELYKACREEKYDIGNYNHNAERLMRDFALQYRLIICEDCRQDENDFIRKFELALRERRAKILLDLWKNNKIPQFKKDHRSKRIKDIEKIQERILDKIQSGYSVSLVKEYADNAITLKELYQDEGKEDIKEL